MKIDRACEVCGAAFQINPGDLNVPGRGKYCSRPCYFAAITKRVEYECAICSRAFEDSGRARGRKYCSRQCTAIAKTKADAVKAHPLYSCWRSMNRRCHDPSIANYAQYGARGITVCDRWRNSFEAFVEDMGERPEGLSIDRIDNDGNYEPSNCRWATVREQACNRRSTIRAQHEGKEMSLMEYAEARGVPYGAIHHRVKRRGETPNQAADYLLQSAVSDRG